MRACGLTVLAVVLVSQLPTLPSLCAVAGALLLWFASIGIVCWLGRAALPLAVWVYCGVFVVAFSWAVVWGHWSLADRLAPSLEGRNLLLQGRVQSLPVLTERGVRFVLRVETAALVDGEGGSGVEPIATFPRKVRLNWYSNQPVKAGDCWQVLVRLKRPHGYVNPGGFDYERWLLSQGIGATGYVRSSSLNTRLVSREGFSINRLRQRIKDQILGFEGYSLERSLAVALTVGDKSAIAPADREMLQNAGLAHLLAISGLHIGLAAAVGMLLGRLLGRFLNGLCPLWLFAPSIALLGAWFGALGYALLAGLSIPTQRAMLMLSVWVVVSLSGLRFSPWFSWWLALAVVFVVFPLSVYDVGVWLSFVAVAILVMSARGSDGRQSTWWMTLLKAQLVLFLGLGLLLWFVGMPVSLVSPLVNALVLPYVSFVVVPVLLLVSAVAVFAEAYLGVLLPWALQPLYLFSAFLTQLQRVIDALGGWQSWVVISAVRTPLSVQVLCFIAVLACFLPLPRSVKALTLCSSVVLFFPSRVDRDGIELVMLDVGQGLSLALHQSNQHWLIDVGRDFHADRIVVPYLQRQAVVGLDGVLVSHEDADHAGGLAAVLESVSVEKLWASHEVKTRWLGGTVLKEAVLKGAVLKGAVLEGAVLEGIMSGDCDEYRSLYWGEVRVSVFGVSPAVAAQKKWNSNNRSCVILLEYAGVKILLPGDIESSRERVLLRHWAFRQSVDVVVAPHHGSGTSSGAAFVEQLQPRWVLISSGYRNPYGHPAPQVMARYRKAGAQVLNTASSGAVHLTVSEAGEVRVDRARVLQQRYWM